MHKIPPQPRRAFVLKHPKGTAADSPEVLYSDSTPGISGGFEYFNTLAIIPKNSVRYHFFAFFLRGLAKKRHLGADLGAEWRETA